MRKIQNMALNQSRVYGPRVRIQTDKTKATKTGFSANAITLASGHHFHRGSGGRAHFQSSSVFGVPSASLQSSFCSAWNARRKVSISQPARLEMFEKVSNSQQRPLAIKNFPASWMCTAEHLFCGTPPVGAPVTLEQLQNTARSMKASNKQAGAIENPNDKEGLKEGLNSVHEKTEGKRCYRCDLTGHTQDDKRCPARDKECRKCHEVGHCVKCCKTNQTKDSNDKKPWRKKPRGPRDTKRSVNQINSDDSPDSEYAFTIVDEKQPMVQVNVGVVPNVAIIVDSGAGCNVIDRKLWEELKQNKVKCVSMKSNKKLYPYGSAEPLKTAGCFVATVTVRNVTVEAEFTVIEGKGPRGGGGTPYNGLYGEAPPERGTFFRLQV